MALGKVIRAHRKKIGMNQRALARESGVTAAHLSNLEKGRTNPTWGTVAKIASPLGLTMADLATRAENEAKAEKQ